MVYDMERGDKIARAAIHSLVLEKGSFLKHLLWCFAFDTHSLRPYEFSSLAQPLSR